MKFKNSQYHYKKGLLWILAAAVLIFGAFYWDAEFRAWLIANRGVHWQHTPTHAVCVALSRYGDWPELLGIATLAAWIAWRAGNREWSGIFLTAIIAAVLAGTLATTSRSLTGRTRPDASPKIIPGWYGPYHKGQILIGVPSYNSFPSGHTATAVGLAAIIFFSRPLWGVPCLLLALSIAASRLYLDKHHLSDVVVSLVMGLGVGWCVWRIVEEKGVFSWIKRCFIHRKQEHV